MHIVLFYSQINDGHFNIVLLLVVDMHFLAFVS